MSTTRPTFHASDFHKSTFSDPQQSCVAVAQQAGWVEIRDSKTSFETADDRRLGFTTEQFATFLNRNKAGVE